MLFIFITPEEIMNTNIKINIVLMLQKKWIYLNNEIIQIVKLNDPVLKMFTVFPKSAPKTIITQAIKKFIRQIINFKNH